MRFRWLQRKVGEGHGVDKNGYYSEHVPIYEKVLQIGCDGTIDNGDGTIRFKTYWQDIPTEKEE